MTYKLSDNEIFDISIGKRVLKNEINIDEDGIPVYSANVFEPFGHIKKTLISNFITPSILWGIDGDWMVNCLPSDIPFYPTDHCGVLRIKKNVIHPLYLAWALEKEGIRVRFSRSNRASMDSIKRLSIKVPSMDIQKKLIDQVQKHNFKISESKKIIGGIAKRKEDVINSYLTDETLKKKEFKIAAEPKVDYKKKKY